MLVRNRRNLPNIDQGQSGVGRRFDPDELGVWTDELGNINFNAGTKSDLDVVRKRNLCEVAVRASIYIRDGYDVRSSCKRLQDVGGGRGPGTECERIAGVLESGDCAFEIVSGIRLAIRCGNHGRGAYRLGFAALEYS
jgi:hypothetical protein